MRLAGCIGSMFKLIRTLFSLGLILVIVFSGGLFYLVTSPLSLKNSQVDFHIARGSSMRAAANEIAGAGVPVNPWLLIVLSKALRVETSIKAGSYEIDRGISTLALLNKLTRGDVTQTEVVFIEGWTFGQMRERLDAHPDVLHDSKGLPDSDILRRIGAPDGSSICRWHGRDRPLIAAVFVNRLRQGMLLQTDPSVIFGVGEKFVGSLRKRDLLTDTPYNTYTRSGLPPTPIAMPGLASLQAALHPAQSQALYFVARGDGSSEFSQTLAEHNLAVSRYQRTVK